MFCIICGWTCSTCCWPTFLLLLSTVNVDSSPGPMRVIQPRNIWSLCRISQGWWPSTSTSITTWTFWHFAQPGITEAVHDAVKFTLARWGFNAVHVHYHVIPGEPTHSSLSQFNLGRWCCSSLTPCVHLLQALVCLSSCTRELLKVQIFHHNIS